MIIVISPLTALMDNQVKFLCEVGILATAVSEYELQTNRNLFAQIHDLKFKMGMLDDVFW